jgi:putative methionine-R-sulfoxide reductase with GAF domain
MATINAVLHHKMDNFFWTGFYLLHDGELRVGSYQGPVACQIPESRKGVCWAAINQGKSKELSNFDEEDAVQLEKIISLIYKTNE